MLIFLFIQKVFLKLDPKEHILDMGNRYVKLEKLTKRLPTFGTKEQEIERNLSQLTAKHTTGNISADVSEFIQSYDIFKKQEQILEDSEQKVFECNPKVLELYSMIGPRRKFSKKITKGELSRCNILYSCCSHDHISSIQYRFAQNVLRLRRRYRSFIDTLIIFKNDKIRLFIQRNKKSKFCSTILFDKDIIIQTKKGESYFDLTDQDQYRDFLKEVDLMRNHFDNYIIKNEKLMAEQVCLICDPRNHRHFIYSDNPNEPVQLEIDTDVCQQSMDWYRFFYNFQMLYRDFFGRVIDFIGCIEKKSFKNWSNREFFFSKTNLNLELNKCGDKVDVNNQDCLDFCSKTFSIYRVAKYFQMTNNIKHMNAVLFEQFAFMSLEEHYEKNLHEPFYIGLESKPIVFFPPVTSAGVNNSLQYTEFIWTEGFGINPFLNLVHVKFYKQIEKLVAKMKNKKETKFKDSSIFMKKIWIFIFFLLLF